MSRCLFADLALRVLYRLRFLSEQHPLDITSFQYCLPLALEILNIANQTEKMRNESEEQITLALEFVSFQATLCMTRLMATLTKGDNSNLPREKLVQRILDFLSFVPAVSKLARDTLLQVTDAISTNETKEELQVLISGLLNPLANVRNVALQALEPFHLEEPQSPEIVYLAMHDTDERNAELARVIYQANSISLGASGLSRLFSLLGKISIGVAERRT